MKKTFLLLLFFTSINLFSQNWVLVETGLPNTENIAGIDFYDAHIVWICTIEGSVAKSTDGGITCACG